MNNNIKLEKKTNFRFKVFKEFLEFFLEILKIFLLGAFSIFASYLIIMFPYLLILFLIYFLFFILFEPFIFEYISAKYSEYLPINEKESKKLKINNIQDYLNFVIKYLNYNVPFYLRSIFFNNQIFLKLFLNKQQIDYMKSLIAKEYDIENLFIICLCDGYKLKNSGCQDFKYYKLSKLTNNDYVLFIKIEIKLIDVDEFILPISSVTMSKLYDCKDIVIV